MTDKDRIFTYDSRTVDPKKPGWYRHNSRIKQTQLFPYENAEDKETNTIRFDTTKITSERNLALRLYDTNITLPGIMRFNSFTSIFEGYTGNSTDGNNGWVAVQETKGTNGQDGKNSITEINGNNNKITNDSEVYELFKDITSEEVIASVTVGDTINNLTNNLFSAPSFTYSDFTYNNNSDLFTLSKKNITFVPFNDNSYKVFVRNNDIYPPVDYSSHTTIREEQGYRITSDGNYAYYYPSKFFKFYGVNYSVIYIHENGYLNMSAGDISFFQNNYGNFFNNFRIGAFFGNLVNNSINNSNNQADVFIGYGKYNELVITYKNFSAFVTDPNDASKLVSNNYNNFQIRLWLNDSKTFTDLTTYSDDYYPPGTIQISYGNSEFQTPLIGLSNKVTYDELTYQPTNFNKLLDIDWDPSKGLGVPELRAQMVLNISNTIAKSNFKTLFVRDSTTLVEQNDDLFYLPLENKNWLSSYSEIVDGIIYYSKIIDLGNVEVDSIAICIKSIFDHDVNEDPTSSSALQKFSHCNDKIFTSENGDSNRNFSVDDVWKNIDETKLISLANLYDVNYNSEKDYVNLYESESDDKGIYNTNLYRIQGRYDTFDVEQSNTEATGNLKLYSGATSKKLLIKIIYTLKSDIDSPTTNSFDNATLITTTPTISGAKLSTGFNFIPGNDDYFKLTVNSFNRIEVSLYDFMGISRRNYSLTMAIWREDIVDGIKIRNILKDATSLSSSYEYPSHIIDNLVSSVELGENITYYIQVSGLLKSYNYGILLKDLVEEEIDSTKSHRVITITLTGINLNKMSPTEQTALIEEIKSKIIEGTDLTESDIIGIIITSGSIKIKVYLISTITEAQAEEIRNILNFLLSFTVQGEPNYFNVDSSIISISSVSPEALPEEIISDTIPVEETPEDPSVPPDDTPSDSITDLDTQLGLRSKETLEGNIHDSTSSGILTSSNGVLDVFASSYLDLSTESNKTDIYYCYLYRDVKSLTSELKLFVFLPVGVIESLSLSTPGFTTIGESSNYPYSITKQGNATILVYGINNYIVIKKIKIEKGATNSTMIFNNINLISDSSATSEYQISQISDNPIYKNNTGVLDDNNNFYFIEISTNFIIKKIDTSTSSGGSNIRTFKDTGVKYNSSYEFAGLYFDVDNQSGSKSIFLVLKYEYNYWVYPYNTDGSEKLYQMFSNRGSIAILRPDNKVVTAGDDNFGGDQNTGDSANLSNISSIYGNYIGYVALKNDKTAFHFGREFISDDEASRFVRTPDLSNTEFLSIYYNDYSFVGVKTDGTLLTWGLKTTGGELKKFSTIVSAEIYDPDGIMYGFPPTTSTVFLPDSLVSHHTAFAGIVNDSERKVLFWGDTSGIYPFNETNVSELYTNNYNSFGVLSNVGVNGYGRFFSLGNLYHNFKYPLSVNTEGGGYIADVKDIVGNFVGWAMIHNSGKVYATSPDDSFIMTGSLKYFRVNSSNNTSIDIEFYSSGQAKLQSDIKSLYATKTSFSALKNDGSVITWGSEGDRSDEKAAAGQYYEENYDMRGPITYKSMHSDLEDNIIEIYNNEYSYVAKKEDGTLVTWGSKNHGGGPYLYYVTDTAQYKYDYVTENKTSETFIKNIKEVIPGYFSYAAITNDNKVVTWGSKYYGGDSSITKVYSPSLNTWTDGTDGALIDIVKVYSSWDGKTRDGLNWNLDPNYDKIFNPDFEHVEESGIIGDIYMALRADNTVIIWGDLNANIPPVDIFNDITDLDLFYSLRHNLDNYTIPIPIFDKSIGYSKTGSICSGAIDNNFYVLKEVSGGYLLILSNSLTTIYEFSVSELDPGDTNNFIDFKFHKDSNVNYLIITFKVNDDDSHKVIILSIDTEENTATKLSFDNNNTPSFDFLNISGSELKCFKYDSNVITVTLFNLSSAAATKSDTTYTLDVSANEPNPLPVNINSLYTDSVLVDVNRIFFTGISEVSLNKYKYSLFLYDALFNTRNIEFSQYDIPEEEIITNIEDEIRFNHLIVNENKLIFDEPLIFRKTTITVNDDVFNVILFKKNNNIILKIYNEDFNVEEIVDIIDNINFCQLVINHNEITVFYKNESNLYIRRFSYEMNMIMNLYLNENSFETPFNKSSNIVTDGNDLYYGIIVDNNDKLELVIYKITQLNNISILNKIELDELYFIDLHIKNDDLIIFLDSNIYYNYNLASNQIEKKYLDFKLITYGITFDDIYYIKNNRIAVLYNNEDLYSIGLKFDNGLYNINILKNGELLTEIYNYQNENEIYQKFRIYQFEINNNNLIFSYTNKNDEVSLDNNLKSFLVIDLESNNIVFNTLKYSLIMVDSFTRNIVLFDVRDKKNSINVIYLYLENGNIKSRNVFINKDYNHILFISDYNSITETYNFYGINKIENYITLDIFNYTDNSAGNYVTYKTDLIDDSNSDENLSLSILPLTYNIKSESPYSEDLIASSQVKVIQVDGSNKYMFNYNTNDSFDDSKYWSIYVGRYVLKNVPSEHPIAILTKNSKLITYKGLSYNNVDPNDSSSLLIKDVTEDDGVTYTYNFYYGDVEINVFGNFYEELGNKNLSFYCYYHGYMGGKDKLNYRNPGSTYGTAVKDVLLINSGQKNSSKYLNYYGNSKNAVTVIGREEGVTYDDDNTGNVYYSYLNSYSNFDDLNNFNIKSNNIPNYQPTYKQKIIKGLWKEETTNSDSTNYYSIGVTNYGWMDTNNIQQGEIIKIPLEPTMASKKAFPLDNNTSNNYIYENFWWKGDLNWNSIMTNTNYENDLFTPMGAIGVMRNGIVFYNWAVNENTIAENQSYGSTKGSSKLILNNYTFITSAISKYTIVTQATNTTSTTNRSILSRSYHSSTGDDSGSTTSGSTTSGSTTSGSTTSGSNTSSSTTSSSTSTFIDGNIIYDQQKGTVDKNNIYHYHCYPITLEGMITMGTVSERDPNGTQIFISNNLLEDNTELKFYIGYTYYLNQSGENNYDSTNNLAFPLRLTKNDDTSIYYFDNTLEINGNPGQGYNSHIKFKIPRDFNLSNTLSLKCIRNGNEIGDFGSLYEKIEVGYNIVNLNLKIVDEKFIISKGDINYDSDNKLYFELDTIYRITPDNSYTNDYKLGILNGIIDYTLSLKDYSEIEGNGNERIIQFRFDQLITGLSFFNQLNTSDNSGDNYIAIDVFEPNSINYYVDVEDSKYKIYNTPSYGSYLFNGILNFEDALNYLNTKKTQTGRLGHSPLLGYAFDGYPIYGPLGYDKSDTNYSDNSKEGLRSVKFLRSSYTSNLNDSNGNPFYVSGSGDLDYCNGIFSKTPEYPNGIYHYICTIDIENDSLSIRTTKDILYGHRNIQHSNMIVPKYPYIIGAYKGIPNIDNFPWISSVSTDTTNVIQSKFNINFRSLKPLKNKWSGTEVNSLQLTQDDNYINMKSNAFPYIWNFTNSLETTEYYGKDNSIFTNKINNLKSELTDETFKSYGNVSKWVCAERVYKGTAVRIINKTVNSINSLLIETYDTVNLQENNEKAAFLGIALKDSLEGEICYVCTKGITSIIINNSLDNLYCGSYGALSLSNEKGQIVGLSSDDSINNDVAVAGYFMETLNDVAAGSLVLFYVNGTFNF